MAEISEAENKFLGYKRLQRREIPHCLMKFFCRNLTSEYYCEYAPTSSPLKPFQCTYFPTTDPSHPQNERLSNVSEPDSSKHLFAEKTIHFKHTALREAALRIFIKTLSEVTDQKCILNLQSNTSLNVSALMKEYA